LKTYGGLIYCNSNAVACALRGAVANFQSFGTSWVTADSSSIAVAGTLYVEAAWM